MGSTWEMDATLFDMLMQNLYEQQQQKHPPKMLWEQWVCFQHLNHSPMTGSASEYNKYMFQISSFAQHVKLIYFPAHHSGYNINYTVLGFKVQGSFIENSAVCVTKKDDCNYDTQRPMVPHSV